MGRHFQLQLLKPLMDEGSRYQRHEQHFLEIRTPSAGLCFTRRGGSLRFHRPATIASTNGEFRDPVRGGYGIVSSIGGTLLVAGDTAASQAVIDKVLSVRDVKWAYITAPNGEVLVDTFVPHFPGELSGTFPQ